MYQLFVSSPCDCGVYIGTKDTSMGFTATEEEAKKWCENFNNIHYKNSWSDHAFYRKVETMEVIIN